MMNHPEVAPRWRRRLKYTAILLLLALLAGELFARFYLGLGDPPLTCTHPTIEYLFAPNQQVRRFGNRFETNSYSMRSTEFSKRKEDQRELRILVLGDSVVNGGVPTDQDDLATELLRRDLRERLDRPIVVGNISAGSWGPPNLLAYIEAFGAFETDIAVIVLSSDDASDVPTFEPLDPLRQPQIKPLTALGELFAYVPLYWNADAPPPDGATTAPVRAADPTSLAAVTELIQILQQVGAKPIVLLYPTRDELASGADPRHDVLLDVCRRAGAPTIELGPRLQESVEKGIDPYRDAVHPNATGQRVIYEALRDAVLGELDEAL